MKESFTDGYLIALALSGDREAIFDVCQLVAGCVDSRLLETRFITGVKRIGNLKMTPDGAFEWRDKSLREEIQNEARNLLKNLSPIDFHNDKDLFEFANVTLKKLKSGRSPNESFGWNQIRRGRPSKNSVFRDWEIRMTVHTLMREYGQTFTGACVIVTDNIPGAENRYKTIEAIARGVNANECPPLPENIFPMSDKSLTIAIAVYKKNIDFIMR
ncbi:MAG: hypothetical protein WC856_00655 [Methylococcaceae bacterium]